ncbi:MULTISPECIES: hypothetical protein [Agrobacterium]|uniref:Uncharacterized protein n=1 Tax=Agrobacterium salinitolerans TaxID=1183413 RepID=A0ABY3BM91_9HYPH|nr:MULTISPECIES: hypothetical protein [Agrobacterium]TRA86291.1 hypothetical protein EXN23_19135 [Agrobacterium salinitolerans]
MSDLMPDFEALLDSPYKQEVETTAARFTAFYRFVTVPSNIAERIATTRDCTVSLAINVSTRSKLASAYSYDY